MVNESNCFFTARQDTWDESYYGEDWGIHRKKLENHIAVIIVGTVYGITIFFVILGSCLFYRHYKVVVFNMPSYAFFFFF